MNEIQPWSAVEANRTWTWRQPISEEEIEYIVINIGSYNPYTIRVTLAIPYKAYS